MNFRGRQAGSIYKRDGGSSSYQVLQFSRDVLPCSQAQGHAESEQTVASLIKKRKSGKDYYYAVKSGRVNGKPRIIWQKYLGSVEEVVERLSGSNHTAVGTAPEEAVCLEFGGPAALVAVAEQLGISKIIDQQIDKRDQGPAVSHYMILAAINRVLNPTSKNRIGDWYQGTFLPRLWKFDADCFSSQNYWDNMDLISREDIEAIESRLAQRVSDVCNLKWSNLLYDTTNFFTYISSANERNTLAQRGHSKAKRNDLRQVGLALVISRGSQIPLLHQVYQGNINDITQFRSACESLADRYASLSAPNSELTVAFDKGNNSEENVLLARLKKLHVVGSLRPVDHPKLLEVPLTEFTQVKDDKYPGVRAYRTRCDALGEERTVVVTFSESFFSQQLHSWSNQLAKATRQLEALNKELASSTLRRGIDGIRKSVEDILKLAPLKDVVKVDITESNGRRAIKYTTDTDAFQDYVRRRGGKTILFTDQHDWTTEDIICAYRGQSEVEQVFRFFKDDEHLHWQPMFHWTDSKILVHGFYCVLGYLLLAVLRHQLTESGLKLSFESLLETLSGMQETTLFYPTGGPPATSVVYTRLSAAQKKIVEMLSLKRFRVNTH